MNSRHASLSPEHVEQLRVQLARDDIDSALIMLGQVANHHGDEDLRQFCVLTRAQLARLQGDLHRGLVSREQFNNGRNAFLLASDEQISARAGKELNPSNSLEPSEKKRPEGPANALDERPPFLSCKSLSKHHPGAFRLPAVSFSLEHGEIAGVVGFNGAGKTTLLRMLATDLAPTTGFVSIGREDDRGRPLRTQVTFVPQIIPPWRGTLLQHLRQRAAFFGFNSETANANVVEATTNLLSLEKYVDRRWEELSGGYRTRAVVAAALVANPGLLVLDEPLAPLDPRAQQKLLQDLRTRASFAGTAIVISSQHIPEVESIADLMILLGEEKPSVRRVDPGLGAEGTLFEVSVHPANQGQLHQLLERLKEQGIVNAFVFGTAVAAARFNSPRAVDAVASIISDARPLYIRDISGSMLGQLYPEL
jgi:ABC-type Na+ transport system ATPase subunit NatA